MNTYTVGNLDAKARSEAREQVEGFLDNMRKSVLQAMNQGHTVALHTHNTLVEQDFSSGGYGVTTDFLQTGWTFGVSIGDWPRKKAV